MAAMVVLGCAHIIIDIRRATLAFVLHPDQRDAILNNVSSHLYIARTVVYAVQTLLGDGFIIYRTYIVSGKSKYTYPLIVIFVSASLGVTIVTGNKYSHATFTETVFDLAPWTLSFFVVTFVINLTCTIIIAFRIWWTSRAASRLVVHSSSSHALKIVVESGAIYSILLITLAATYSSKSWSQYIVLDIVVQAIGIVFTLIILRVSLGVSHETTFVNTPRSRRLESTQRSASSQPIELEVVIAKHTTDEERSESASINAHSIVKPKTSDLLTRDDFST
ncbi:hypothetical protein SCHPADRAFT_947828 [Schizopora paradoxa]|uniref:Transmembrane protein n=1 Tax=Schizopora paradoxa TaxID=27342 RepID=A0A0H2QZ76_9AGAM|nr:hypothetical protein SCHPADRAFT_947828 [Schizopora paradoxa]